MIRGKRKLAIMSFAISTLLYTGILMGDFQKALIFTIGNGLGMAISMYSAKEEFKARRYTITPPSVQEGQRLADCLRSHGLSVITSDGYYNKKPTLIVTTVANAQCEKELVKQKIPCDSAVSSYYIKFNTIWEDM